MTHAPEAQAAAHLSRVVARDELADLIADLDVLREDLTRFAPGTAAAHRMRLTTARALLSQTVIELTRSIEPPA